MNISSLIHQEILTDAEKKERNYDCNVALLDLVLADSDLHRKAWSHLIKICKDDSVSVPTYQQILDENPVFGEECSARLKRNSEEFGEDRTGNVWPFIVRLPGGRAINLRGGYFLK